MKKAAILLSLSLICLQSFSQTYLGVFGGISNYLGDLEEKKYNFKKTKPAFGLVLSHDLSERITLRGGLTIAKIAGDDKLSASASLQRRNLNFESNLLEVSAIGEINAFSLQTQNWTPYIFAGLGLYHFNPYTFDSLSNKILLQPLSTEGQGLPGYNIKPYGLTQLAVPFGGGIKFNINENIRLGFEVGLRKIFTDYIDDVSTTYADENDLRTERGQIAVDLAYRGDETPLGDPVYPAKGEQRGNAKQKDMYFFTGLHVSFSLPSGSSYRGSGKRSGYGCPPVPY